MGVGRLLVVIKFSTAAVISWVKYGVVWFSLSWDLCAVYDEERYGRRHDRFDGIEHMMYGMVYVWYR